MVVGAGIFGLKLAELLSDSGATVVVLERGRVGAGASSRNQGTITEAAAAAHDAFVAGHLTATQLRSLCALGSYNHRLLRGQIDRLGLACDYERAGYALFAREDSDDCAAALTHYRRQATDLASVGVSTEVVEGQAARELSGSPVLAGGIRFPSDAQFHSGKFVTGLAAVLKGRRGVRVYEGCSVSAVVPVGTSDRRRVEVTANGYRLLAQHVVVATNAFAPQLVPHLVRRVRPERGQVLVTEPLAHRPCRGSFGTSLAWWRDIREPNGRFRLLFGGARHRDQPDSLLPAVDRRGRRSGALWARGSTPTVAHQRRLDTQLHQLFPELRGVAVTHRWAGVQAYTADAIPVVGAFDPERHIHGAAGFSGNGNAFSNVAAGYLMGLILTGSDGDRLPEQHRRTAAQLFHVGRPPAEWSASSGG